MKIPVQFMIPIILLLWLTKTWTASATLALPGCQDRCGDVLVPYPFGIGGGNCSMGKGFEVTCNVSFNPPKPFITTINMELVNVSLDAGVVQVMSPVRSSNCLSTPSSIVSPVVVDLSNSPFVFSREYNKFTATGCDNFATISEHGRTVGGCMSTCQEQANVSTGCYGFNCCQTMIPPNLLSLNMSMTNLNSTAGCMSASMVEQVWFDNLGSVDELSQMEHVPAVLEWGKKFGSCRLSESSDIFCDNSNDCWGPLNDNFLCECKASSLRMGEMTYIDAECPGGSKCYTPDSYTCYLKCVYTPGSPNCTCPADYLLDPSGDGCYPFHIIDPVTKNSQAILIGCLAGIGMVLLLIGSWWMYKKMERRKDRKLKEKYFKRNGGLLMQQQLSSSEGNIERAKFFTSKELDKATDDYNENRILGQGGQGTVYKGMLMDGRLAAIKKSRKVDEDKLDQFINEVMILSQIIHRNVVKLLGCCLETEVPLLVYEFVPNGNLDQVLHHQTEEFPLTWEMRLRIAVEVASALSYLHSSASIPIYHRDIKSSNILLDDKYRAKVSDFGTSRSLAVDETHLTTRVMGTFGYLDPEYFQSSQFTDKSDVYSFGVVLVELLTGRKPISSSQSEDERGLATLFLFLMEENRLFEIIDARVEKESRKEDVMRMANLARRCLNLNGKKRPTMREVSSELEGIRGSQGAGLSSVIDERYEDFDYGETIGPWDAASSSNTTLQSDTVTLL